jgi:hypothetical protein
VRLPTFASTHREPVPRTTEAVERQAGASPGIRQQVSQADTPWRWIDLCPGCPLSFRSRGRTDTAHHAVNSERQAHARRPTGQR